MATRIRRTRATPSKAHPHRSTPLWALAWTASGTGVRTLTTLGELEAAFKSPDTRVWIDLEDPERDLLLELCAVLNLHPLVVEDILERNQRAKIEETGEELHIVMFGLHHEEEQIVKHEIDIVLGKRFLLTVHDAGLKPREAPFMRRDKGAHIEKGVDYTLWALSDWLVDDYFPVFDKLGDEIDELEDRVLQIPSRSTVERLFDLRKDLLVIRHAVNPVREIFNQLTNRALDLITEERVDYFRDVYDHLVRLNDELDSYRELVSTALDIYLSQVNNNLSEIMKRLTGVTAVLATIGAIGGIFGMSEAGLAFQFQEAAGFWLVTIFAIMLALLVAYYFKKRNWI
jgi:magnesium transporter